MRAPLAQRYRLTIGNAEHTRVDVLREEIAGLERMRAVLNELIRQASLELAQLLAREQSVFRPHP